MGPQGPPYYSDEPPEPHESSLRVRMKTLIEVPADAPKYFVAVIPIRILAFILTIVLLLVLICVLSGNTVQFRDASGLLLVATTTAFIFFSILHIIGHCGGDAPVEFPMIFGSFIAVVCYTYLAGLLIHGKPTVAWGRLTATILCCILAGLHALDVLLTFAYWRNKYTSRRKLSPTKPMHATYDSHPYSQTLPPYTGRAYNRDLQTSMAGTGMIRDPYDDDPYRMQRAKKSEGASSRSYVERPGRSGYYMRPSKGMQSNYSPIQHEAQTTTIDVKEMPVQTPSRSGLSYRHVDVESHSPRQYNAPIYEEQHVPMHSTPSPSPTRKNLICACKHHANYIPPLNSTIGPTGGQCCGSCNCSTLTSTKKSTVKHSHQHQPQQILNTSTSPRCVDTTGANPNFDMNLNVGLGDNKHVKETHRVYEARSSSSRTKPFIGRLAALSGCLFTPSSTSLRVHKNKRTQTKGQTAKKPINPKKENVRNMNNDDRDEIDEEKFIAKEIEVRSIDLNSAHRVMPKHESTPKKGINVKSHRPLPGHKVIEVKEKKNDGEELKLKPDVLNKEKNDSGELTQMEFDSQNDWSSSKTRTKTLYRVTQIKPARIENDEVNEMLLRSDLNPDNTERRASLRIPFLQVKRENRINTTSSPTMEEATSIKPTTSTSDNNDIFETKDFKNIGQDEAVGGTGWRFQIETNSGSKLLRAGELHKDIRNLNPSKEDRTPQSRRETATDESKAKSGLIEDEIFKQFRRIKIAPKANDHDTELSVYD